MPHRHSGFRQNPDWLRKPIISPFEHPEFQLPLESWITMGLDLLDLPDQFLYIGLDLVYHPLRRLFRGLEWVFDVPERYCFTFKQVFGPGILLRLKHHPLGCIHQVRRELGLNP